MRRCTDRAGYVLRIALAVVGLGLGAVMRAEAQGGWSAADAAALKGHSLTMDKLRRTNEVMIEFDRLQASRDDPADDEDATMSVNGLVKKINAVPEARAILAKHRLTTRDYVLTMFAATNAAAAGLTEESGGQATGLPVSRGQVAFYKANKTEIDKMFAQRKAASEPDDSEDDQEE